jgi:ATP-dependent exoDNAse (exonuclease V) alpha subunit
MTQLTQGQQKASDAFFEFLMSEEPFFSISGPAGTGKTFLMSHLCETVMQHYHDACKLLDIKPEFFNLAFTATTNKAAEVLEQSLKKQVSTIHSFLGLRVRNDYRTGKTLLDKTRNWHVRKKYVLFIDECSMIDAHLLKLILETMQDSKIIFVGDHAQMAPINEKQSQLYDLLKPENFCVLTEPVRNAGQPALVDLCAQLRHTVETGEFSPIEPAKDVVTYLNDNQVLQKLDELFKDPDPSCRVLCYTNERVQEYNQHIRQSVRKLPEEIQVGDVLVVAQNGKAISGDIINVEREIIVEELIGIEEDHSVNFIFPDEKPIQYYRAKIRNLSGAQISWIVRIPLQPERVTYAVKAFAKKAEWHFHYRLKEDYMDLREKAACTVYKAQGSTYDTVIIDLNDIGKSFDAAQVARMLYVGASRARKQIYLFGSLPWRYQGARVA